MQSITPSNALVAREASLQLASGQFEIRSSDGQTVQLPAEALPIFQEVLEQLAQQRTVVVLALDSELSTFEAADLLNVSRPHVTKMLERGEIPFRMVGTHHRIRLADVLQYQTEQRQRSLAAMQELADLSQELGLY